jgi:hypothetical protein
MWHVWVREEVRREFWWGNMSDRDYMEDIGVNGRIILKSILNKSVRMM